MSMDICPHIGLSVTDDVNNLHALFMNTSESTQGVEDFSVDKLGKGVTESLNINDGTKDNSASTPPYKKPEFQKKNACGAPEVSTNDDKAKSVGQPGSRSTSMPTQSKPASAMKGSCEKRGIAPPTKLTVKWAPDVYDPIPTSVSHVVPNNRSWRHNKKNSKNKQKNGSKSSRGTKSKDKKQARKRGGNSSGMGYKFPEHEEETVEPEPGAMGYHVANPDRFCGSSLLKRYGPSLHLSSVAEAT